MPDSISGQIFDDYGSTEHPFVSLVSVCFSAFDSILDIDPAGRVKHTYISLNSFAYTQTVKTPKIIPDLSLEFESAIDNLTGERLERWKAAISIIETDTLFQELDVLQLAGSQRRSDLHPQSVELFANLSSGHKIVLLAITHLATLVAEATLVLIDEPETHLHPPLLSAFIRATSEILVARNGVAIIATHSPVVLQEIPRSCVWKLRRSGEQVVADRPDIETFGENVGVLTHEAFGLEVTRSGFHQMLVGFVEKGLSYRQIVDRFGGRLGNEAKSLISALVASRDRGR
jgi:hypothetical protein